MRTILKQIKTKNRVFKKKYVSTYSEKQQWRIILPEEVYIKLKDSLSKIPPTFNFDESIALYYLSLISSLPSYKKDKIYPGGYVNLEAKKLQKTNYNYLKYFDYFIENGLLQKNDSYSNAKGKGFCKSYRYNLKELKNLTWYVFELEVLQSLFGKVELKEKTMCQEPRYLTKWFNSNLTIDSKATLLEIQQKLKYTSQKEKNTMKKAENYLRSLKNFHFKEFWSSRNPLSDNRFHTNLANMPKFFRKYILYNGKTLAGVDIKNSQPYFLIILFDFIIDKNNLGRCKIIEKMIMEFDINGTMIMTLSKNLTAKGFQKEYCEIKYNILNGTFYDNLETHFKFERGLDKKYKRRFYCRDTKTTPTYFFDKKRDVVKRLVLFFLYKNNQENENKEDADYLIFKKLYPNFCNVLELLKQNNKKDLPKLLQHIEADCVIDYTCKKISKKYPNMPLFTIHDSIITTEDNIDILETEVIKHLKDYCNDILPTLETEYWRIDCKQQTA